MKTGLTFSILVSLLFFSGPTWAYLDPVVQALYPQAKLDQMADDVIKMFLARNINVDTSDIELTRGQIQTPGFQDHLKKSMQDTCDETLENYVAKHPNDPTFQFQVELDLNKLTAADIAALPADIRTYREGQVMTVSFTAQIKGCRVECPTTSFPFGDQVIVSAVKCHVKPVIERVGDYSTDDSP